MIFKQNQSGVTLIELMIAMLIGLIVVGATLTIFLATLKSSNDNLNMIRLNQELRSIVTLMVNDIRRAGYITDLASFNRNNWANSASSIKFYYDTDSDGDYDEFEYKNDNGTIKVSGAVNGELSDPSVVEITGFSIINNNVCTTIDQSCPVLLAGDASYVQVSSITFTINGRLTNDNAVSKSVTETVRIRNDNLVTPP